MDETKMLPIEGYNRYLIDRNGNCIVAVTGETVLWHKSNGYLFSRLVNNEGVRRSVGQHRAIALAHIPMPNVSHKLTVNHKDGNKANNVYSNLEWASYSENTKHAFDTGLRSDTIKVIVTNLITNEVLHFNSRLECRNFFSLNYGIKILGYRAKSTYKVKHFSFEEIKPNPHALADVAVCARNITTGKIIVAENASELSTHIGLHPKVIRRIIKQFRFQYPTNGYDIRVWSIGIKWSVYTKEEILAYPKVKFIHQPVNVVNNTTGEIILFGGVLIASEYTKTNQRSIRFCMENCVPCPNGFNYYKFTRKYEINA